MKVVYLSGNSTAPLFSEEGDTDSGEGSGEGSAMYIDDEDMTGVTTTHFFSMFTGVKL